MFIQILVSLVFLYLLGFNITRVETIWAQATSAPEEDSKDVVIPESIKGFDEEKVKNDPICDSSKRPKITGVSPDEVKPGDKVKVTGEHFGKKKGCLHAVTFGPEDGKDLTYIDNQSLEVTVPDTVPSGLVFLNVFTGGGSARSAVLVK